MAFTTTTLAAACDITSRTIVVASATGFGPGSLVKVDEEMMQVTKEYVAGATTVPVLRGQDGTQQLAHPVSTNVTVGLASDFANPGPGGPAVTFPSQRARIVRYYSAAGAIALPPGGQDMLVIINGTGALAMTLAVPTKDMDGCRLTVLSGGKAAHTVTASGGFGANTTASDVMTFHATQTVGFECMAANGVWVLLGFVAGAATVAGPGLA